MAVGYRHPRGTRAALTSLAAANGLTINQVYHITDENRLAVATAVNAFSVFTNEADMAPLKNGSLDIIIDGGGVAIAAAKEVIIPYFPFAATVTGWTIAADASTTSVVTISKATYANFPTWTAISGTEKPTLTAAQKNQDLSLTTWTTSIAQGDFLRASVDSNNNAKLLTLGLNFTRT